ncbi:MAG: AbrB/MazE/SpoVT family DNA-binding domain-containing protein [Planctomycetota bacterium]
MTTTVVTTKGQIVIPSKIRRKFNIKKGTRLCIVEKNNEIVLKPLTAEYFEGAAGILKSGGKTTKALLAQRTKDKAAEERK